MLRSNYHHSSHLKINFHILSRQENYQNTVVFLEDDCVSCNKLVIWFLFPELGLLPTFTSHSKCTIILPDLNKMEWEEKVEKYFGKFGEGDSSTNGMDLQLKLEQSVTDPFCDEDDNVILKEVEAESNKIECEEKVEKSLGKFREDDNSINGMDLQLKSEESVTDLFYDEDNNVIHEDDTSADPLYDKDGGLVLNGKDDACNTKAIRAHFGNIIPIVKDHVDNVNEDLRFLTNHEQVLKECQICRQISRKRGGIFKRHVISDHPYLNFFACDSCEFIAFTDFKLRTHFQRIHVESTLTMCPKCGIERKNLRNHIKHCTGESKPEMKIKGGNYEDFIQVEDRTFNCLHCPKKFSSWQQIYAHVYHSINTDQIKIKMADPNSSSGYKMRCKKCFHLFPTSKSLFHHERTAHTWTKEERECMYCTQEFKSISLKKNHERRHVTTTIERTKDHQCTVCGKRFYNTNALKSHMDYHRQSRDFECSECGNKYKSKSTLSNHFKRVHEQIQPYSCGDCGKRFYSRGDCEKHETIHTSKKTLPCLTCGKLFRRKDDVKKHSRIHSSIKPYGCKFCDKTFNQTPNMWVHIKKHHAKELSDEKEAEEASVIKMEVTDPDYDYTDLNYDNNDINGGDNNPLDVSGERPIKHEEVTVKNEIAFND